MREEVVVHPWTPVSPPAGEAEYERAREAATSCARRGAGAGHRATSRAAYWRAVMTRASASDLRAAKARCDNVMVI